MSYIHQEAFVICAKINEKSSNTVVVTDYCEECQLDLMALPECGCEKNAVYELLRASMVGGLPQAYTRYHDKDIKHIRIHEKKANLQRLPCAMMQILYVFTAQVT